MRVRFWGWPPEFDAWIDLLLPEHRIDIFGAHTEGGQEEKSPKNLAFAHDLQAQGLYVSHVRGDGNCLFRAVAHQIWGDEERHAQLRGLCVDYMRANNIGKTMFARDELFQKHLADISADGAWADDPEIRALEELLDRRINVWNSELQDGKSRSHTHAHLCSD